MRRLEAGGAGVNCRRRRQRRGGEGKRQKEKGEGKRDGENRRGAEAQRGAGFGASLCLLLVVAAEGTRRTHPHVTGNPNGRAEAMVKTE